MSKLLIIDDERAIRVTLKDILEYEKHKVDIAESGAKGIDLFKKNKYDLVICDIVMEEMDGVEVFSRIKQINSDTPIFMMSGQGTVETAVEVMKIGASDFIEKPICLNTLLKKIASANTPKQLKLVEPNAEQDTETLTKYKIIGSSEVILKLKEKTDKVAKVTCNVLITGENGTGKELIAQRIHRKSDRHNEAFIDVNCAAIPKGLIESELFGHKKGSFTSANETSIGKLEQANNGTIFLDEIGDLSLSAQAKILRVLEERTLFKVGSNTPIRINIRVIAATNKNLEREVKKKKFRKDLYYRLNTVVLKVPNLIERTEDIPLLISYFLEKISTENNLVKLAITDKAILTLQKANWEGNVRELKNVIERLLLFSENRITAKDVELNL